VGKSARASSRRRRAHTRKQPLLLFGTTRPFVESSGWTGQIGICPNCSICRRPQVHTCTRTRAHTRQSMPISVCTNYARIFCLCRRPQVHTCTRTRAHTHTHMHAHTRQSMPVCVCTNYARIPCVCLRLGVDATYIDARRRMHRYGGLVPHTAPSVSRHTRHTYFAPLLSIHTKHAHVK